MNEALLKLRGNENGDAVDRQLLKNLIISFVQAPRGTSKPFQVLQVICNVLNFDENELVNVGLKRGEMQMMEQNFADLWVSFLETEASKNGSFANYVKEQESTPQQPSANNPNNMEDQTESRAKSSPHTSIFARLLGA